MTGIGGDISGKVGTAKFFWLLFFQRKVAEKITGKIWNHSDEHEITENNGNCL